MIVAVTARSVPVGSVLFAKGSDPPPTTTSAPVLPTKLKVRSSGTIKVW